jgi:hypothetical protein
VTDDPPATTIARPATVVLTHIGIFLKLRPTTATGLSRRVKAALICLAHRHLGPPSG